MWSWVIYLRVWCWKAHIYSQILQCSWQLDGTPHCSRSTLQSHYVKQSDGCEAVALQRQEIIKWIKGRWILNCCSHLWRNKNLSYCIFWVKWDVNPSITNLQKHQLFFCFRISQTIILKLVQLRNMFSKYLQSTLGYMMNKAQRHDSQPYLQGEHSHTVCCNVKGFQSRGVRACRYVTMNPAGFGVCCKQATLILNIPNLKWEQWTGLEEVFT